MRIRLSRLRGIRISLVKPSNCGAETKINDLSQCLFEVFGNWLDSFVSDALLVNGRNGYCYLLAQFKIIHDDLQGYILRLLY